ncbi:threonine dehydratase [Arenibaculum pallidiluteum]|uniref:threonine dehydratase n=1 Tax=Arenibaculum pallidiluteum TaxID=2812559 RepID=UPI001A961D54|nr:threonine dehydratase [Arenibaculum pallidiluteum]
MPALNRAATIVGAVQPPTPQIAWPLLAARTGCDVWVKHENHGVTGAFKLRGGLVYLERLKAERPQVPGIVSATRGNHGQSLAFAARRVGLPAAICVPRGNSAEKNAAMRAFGAELIEAGRDFDQARSAAARIAQERGYEMVPALHTDLVTGVATYARELFGAVPDLDTVYVAIGMGSGICGLIRTRDLLGLRTRIVGVVSTEAPAYALSVAAGQPVSTETARTFADGIACRMPCPEAVAAIAAGADRILQVSDPEIAAAIRILHEDTHNTAEGAGAAALAGLLQEREAMRGRRVAVILSGGNIDRAVLARVLGGGSRRQRAA